MTDRSARARWLVVVTSAETLGYLAPALTGILVTRAGWSARAAAIAIVLAGCVEGFALGVGQAIAFPIRVRRLRYALLTAAGAGAVWALVMTMMAVSDRLGMAALVVAPIGLLAIGCLQWLELRTHGVCASWIGWTALAWLAALPLSFLPGLFVDEATPLPVHVALWTLGGAAMASVMAAVTWQGVRALQSSNRIRRGGVSTSSS